jgi:methyltransferase (TIGR00027 family)
MSTTEHGNVPAGGNTVAGGWGVTRSVGLTALAVAAARAAEAERPGALATDRFAAGFVRAAEPAAPLTSAGGPAWDALVDMMAIRTRVLDDLMLAAAGAGIRQVVVPAAGLDARAYRLPWPSGVTVHEIDQAEVLSFKQHVLDAAGAVPHTRYRPVACDLREDWPTALRDSGFDPAAPTAWLVEGLLPYLPPDAEADLFARITELSAPGSRIAVETLDQAAADGWMHSSAVRELGAATGCDLAELWDTRRRPAAVDVLHGHGWRARGRGIGDLGAELGRVPSGPAAGMVTHATIVDAER